MPTELKPDANHPITLAATKGRVRARFDDHVIADSADVLMLREADYPAVAYFPREDVDMAYMGKTDHHSHCPYKGVASYYTLRMDGRIAENAVWSYEEPYEAMEAIRGRLAFYPEVVEIESDEANAPLAGIDPSDVIRHTDSGSGASQAEPWKPTTDGPGTP